jgi:hypothetical protein
MLYSILIVYKKFVEIFFGFLKINNYYFLKNFINLKISFALSINNYILLMRILFNNLK